MQATFSGVRQFFLGLMLMLPLFGGTAYAQAQDSRVQESQAQRQQVQPGNNAPVWREVRSGKEEYTSIKGRETGVLIQTEGETWRRLRNGPITLYGGWLVVLVLIAMLQCAMRSKLEKRSIILPVGGLCSPIGPCNL